MAGSHTRTVVANILPGYHSCHYMFLCFCAEYCAHANLQVPYYYVVILQLSGQAHSNTSHTY